MQNSPRKILFLTGTRADFGKLRALIGAVAHSPLFDYAIFATGMHMLARYGSTVLEIGKAGFDRIYPYVNQDGSVSSQMDLVLANTIQGLGHYIREFRPDLIVVHGDRVETLAGAIVGALNNILVAHVEGGELSGTVDELIRHAVSKLSHLHFVSNETSRDRLLQMGETEESVFVIGSPDIDVMLSDALPSLEEVRLKYEIAFAHYGILIYHPVTTEPHCLRSNIQALLRAARASGRKFVALYPNNDAGAEIIIEALEGCRQEPWIHLLPSMRFEYFLALLKHAAAVVGNSSAGIREAPVYGIPTVNVGSRQTNRFHYPYIVNVPDEESAIVDALRRLPHRVPRSLHFGKGDSAKRFAERLQDPRLWATPRQKQFRDIQYDAHSRAELAAAE